MSTFEYLMRVKREKGAGYLLLLDPDRLDRKALAAHIHCLNANGVDAILVGSSFLLSNDFDQVVEQIKKEAKIPVIIFPGGIYQISPKADAILFLSLLSGRNSEFLIGQQVKAAPILRDYGLESISTGYLLVESGRPTTVEYISNTHPIPRGKPEIAVAHALAAQYLGMRLLYLDAGSGAEHSVPEEMIQAVADSVSLPLIVGGGIRQPEVAQQKVLAGSSFVVIGTALEQNNEPTLLEEFAKAIHIREG
ncbi:MAG: geranylgeranylglyceryl/heptaprenylglyceryl phosphate synthase [Candidatus Latescibacterota bacterium]|nr:MAG: geranylgeranylglyceryl/heptaprenylglyceryl phosphate synthase [Candidatus Latescibacterota bacterium]RKY72140.1 MAG: geranylgeranylglyceryl/heptaprenylglyceryl phosphate synthase [Candidatus Latescibacterota bacterium]